jgi:hypothetical protein
VLLKFNHLYLELTDKESRRGNNKEEVKLEQWTLPMEKHLRTSTNG